MRTWLLLLVAACSTSTPVSGTCPAAGNESNDPTGMACDADGATCFALDGFSSCESATYRCTHGSWQYDHGLPAAGQACADAPIASCESEGNPSCTDLPTSASCSCGSDGIWHCDCACYGSMTTCPVACPTELPAAGPIGPMCSDEGATCSYPGHTCTCTGGTFSCT